MNAVCYAQSLPTADPRCLEEIAASEPALRPRDLLIAAKAVSIDPVDAKLRMRAAPETGIRPSSSMRPGW